VTLLSWRGKFSYRTRPRVLVLSNILLTFVLRITQVLEVIQHGFLELIPLAPVLGVVRVGKRTAGGHDDDASVCCTMTVRVLVVLL
jgi:hypothetical protein